MSLYHHLKTWLGKKREHPHEEETVALPEIHTGKVAHHTDADGTPADSEKLDKAVEKNHLIITNASAYIYCPYPVLYISEGVVMGEDGYVDASQSDGVVTILMKK